MYEIKGKKVLESKVGVFYKIVKISYVVERKE